MTCESIEPMLDDYVDGALDSASTREVERHLASCPSCSADVAAQRALLARVAAAPRSVEPARDLWPAIVRAHGAERAQRSRRWTVGWMQIAAAALLMALSSAATYALLGRGDTVGGAPHPVSVAPAPAQLRLVDAQYVPLANELAALLETHRAELAPSTVATVERSLRVIDAAIAEARAALATDPSNADLVDLLSSGYKQKIDLLRRSTQLTPRS